ncbi:MAG: prolipoprotein diacylglyceryl transferase [Nanoarchaeota archaeon]|nr:prolipoprotein diacylglyceryl transferase [Nanoarchaeota archaeon]MBU1270313.1 prolipoprotein diacylglyceryl transferase [Nanoarchaeota archaeon]MBU1603962.1 prolipoprotein diacylglyceryl transferase [Nanoarchaeota archaeon]
MFIHNINPVLVKLGFLEIRYYSLVYIIGFLVTYYILLKLAKKKKIKNLTKEGVEDFMIYFILGSIIGGRVLDFLFYNPSVFWTNPLEILYIWHGGMSFHGGLIGAITGAFLFIKKHKVEFYDLADIIVLPLSFFLFLGRIANFINGELWGTVTNVSWCVKFQGVEDCRHPSQLYEAAKNLAIFGFLMFFKKRKLKKGVIFWNFVLLYGALRFITNIWREDSRFLGLSMGQYLSLAMVILAGIYLYRINSAKTKK